MITIQQVYSQVQVDSDRGDVLLNGRIICEFGHNEVNFTQARAMHCHGWYIVKLVSEKLEIYNPDEGLGIVLKLWNGEINIEMY